VNGAHEAATRRVVGTSRRGSQAGQASFSMLVVNVGRAPDAGGAASTPKIAPQPWAGADDLGFPKKVERSDCQDTAIASKGRIAEDGVRPPSLTKASRGAPLSAQC